MIYHATVYLTVVHSFEVEAESRDAAEIEAMEIAERRVRDASSIGIDSVHVMEVEEEYASTRSR